MKAEIISIGTELLLGTIIDTNAQYLAQRLADLGIDCYYISQIGDNPGRLAEVLRRAWDRSDLTVTTGGLGPTGDDLTREAIAEVLGETPSVIPALEANLRGFFARRGSAMPQHNLKQATLVPSADAIMNPVGTAPGWWVQRESNGGAHMIVSMPGVPFEMKRMWENEVEPRLASITGTVIVSRTLKTLGIGESAVEEMVDDLMQGSNPTLAPYAKADGVHLRITAKAADRQQCEAMIAELEEAVRSRLGTAIYGIDAESPQKVVQEGLAAAQLRVIVLEVGKGAVGAVAPLLADSEWLSGAFALHDLEHAVNVLALPGEPRSLEHIGQALLARAGADLLVAVHGAQEATDPDGVTVRFDATMLVLGASETDPGGALRATQSWKTASSEVPRLLGLATLNLLRRYLGTSSEKTS
jgi:nicotinamide-nucleotide amidase